jgi:hypothetical protein
MRRSLRACVDYDPSVTHYRCVQHRSMAAFCHMSVAKARRARRERRSATTGHSKGVAPNQPHVQDAVVMVRHPTYRSARLRLLGVKVH